MADWTDNELPENIMKSLEVDDLAVNYDISASTVYSKNSATAWVNFDGTTTPPTIRDSFNVSDVVRTATGTYEVYFEDTMINSSYSVLVSGEYGNGDYGRYLLAPNEPSSIYSVRIYSLYTSAGLSNSSSITIQIFGGK